jgi:hypothetical protein
VVFTGIRSDDSLQLSIIEEETQSLFCCTTVVADDCQILGASLLEGIDGAFGDSTETESADQDCCASGDGFNDREVLDDAGIVSADVCEG